ncbi:MAG: type II toxin-antitoxin system VapC family toxin [Deltaproteobacteria bacterium]|nr:type II toxin-antitoxin system VapC family toxin [Deltaproteobacteria bacterium]
MGRRVSRLYLDSSSIIYLVESSTPFHETVVARLMKHGNEPNAVLITSRLARLECRTKPLREANEKLLADYEAFFSAKRLVVVDLSAEVIERATELRARHGLKTPDALHVATALLEAADVFLTGDIRIGRCPALPVEILTI